MTLFLCALCAGFTALTLPGHVLPQLIPFLGLPHFSGTACALVGVIIASLEYRQRKGRKKKRAPMLLIIVNALLGILAAAVWLFTLISKALP